MVARLRWRSEDHGLRGPTWPHHFYLVAPLLRRGKPLLCRSKVRYRGQLGKHFLVLSLQTSAAFRWDPGPCDGTPRSLASVF